MYAIFEAKGKQFRAERDEVLRMPSLKAAPGDTVTFDQVLLAERDGKIIVGQPTVDGASIAVEVVRHGRGEKIVVYKMKRRKGYRKKQGHRQNFTEVRVTGIDLGKERSVEKAAPAKLEKTAEKTAAPAKPEKKAAPAPEAVKDEKPAEAVVEEVTVETVVIDATNTARELADEAGIDLASIEGTGKDGRILKSDVAKAIKGKDEA
jgi:large subunit ribosomal protein L21